MTSRAKAVPEPSPAAVLLARIHDQMLLNRPHAVIPDEDRRLEAEEEAMEETRTCADCGVDLPLREFSPRGRGWSKTFDDCMRAELVPAAQSPVVVVQRDDRFDRIREVAQSDMHLSQVEGLARFLGCDLADAVRFVLEIRGS